MRQSSSRCALAGAWLALGCAVAMEERPLGAGNDDETGGRLSISGAGGSGTAIAGSSSGKGGTPGNGFGGSASSGGAGGKGSAGAGGKAAGGAAGSSSGAGGTAGGTSSGGVSSGGKAGSASGGNPSGGNASGGNAAAGTSSGGGGSGSAGGPGSTVCDGTPDWTSKTYVMGDTVASTCAAPFDHGCPIGQSHKFECNPMPSGAAGLPWCMSRQPGVGNGWWEAWLDKGQCQ